MRAPATRPRSLNSRLIRAFVQLAVALAAVFAAFWIWFHHRARPGSLTGSPFVGVMHAQTIRDAPRPVILHLGIRAQRR